MSSDSGEHVKPGPNKTVVFRGMYSLILLSACLGALAIAMSTQTPVSAAQTADSNTAADTYPEFPPGEGREAVQGCDRDGVRHPRCPRRTGSFRVPTA